MQIMAKKFMQQGLFSRGFVEILTSVLKEEHKQELPYL